MKIILFVAFFQIFYNINPDPKDRLVFVYTHFRHGARAPNKLDDNFNDMLKEHWTNPGELTSVGERQHYLLGLRNRKRYIKDQTFLSEKFDPHEILVYSSNFNRTMMSASSHLQGFYPQKDLVGNVLTKNQIKVAYPPVNVNCDEINEEIVKLDVSALPYRMNLPPIRMINDNERKMVVYDLKGCTEKRDMIKKQNEKSIPLLAEETTYFNEKYGEKLNRYFGTENKEYSFSEMSEFCDAVRSSYVDQRDLTEFKKIFDLEEMYNYCVKYYTIKYQYQIHGDKDKILAHVESSNMIREFIYYMKRRLDADITEVNEDENLQDYSKPKMFMLSGHDSTISADEILLIHALNLNESEKFVFPRFAAQLAIEVKTKKNGKKSSYSDYYVVGYIDDKEIFNLGADVFINKIEKEIWSEKQVNDYCGLDNSYNLYYSNLMNKKEQAYKLLMIIFICLSVILLVLTMHLSKKIKRLKNSLSINTNINPKNSTNSIQEMK